MFGEVLLLVLCFSELWLTESAGPTDRAVAKRGDVDLQTCIDNFAVHTDKIIRTQDSRDMGAKYLNEIDLDTREECLRLCCETENCDVFVYEEKSVGSCYLFQCGPPENFKCKFTHHVNYSSGVLTVNRHLPDLESQIKLTKHEQDLTKLRKPEAAGVPGNPQMAAVRTTPSTTTTTTTAKGALKSAENTKSPPENSKCSRFQFECRSNRECIAIYNACDGIPQCSDGSDEAPELGCPGTFTTSPPPPPPPPPNHPINSPLNYNAMDNQPARISTKLQSPDIYRPPMQHQNPAVQNPQRQTVDFLRPVADQRNSIIAQSGQYEVPQMPQFPQYQQPPQNNWMPHQSNQMPAQLMQYPDKNSHIFNHKESGLQVPDGQETRYNKYKGAMQTLHRALGYSGGRSMQQYGDINTHEYPKLPNYYGEVYRQPMQPVQENWANPPVPETNYHNVPYVPEVANSIARETWHPNAPAVQPEMEQNPKPPLEELPQNWKSEEENAPHVQNKLAHDLKHSKEHFEKKAVEAKPVKIEKHVHSNHDHDYFVAERLELQDGIAEAPGGAILSLTLGLIITCLMAVLIGCRLRVVRRRMRRGGKSYAHDADYLVNGMYL